MSYSPFDLHGKVALITGGNGGIGLGMADALAQAGADVAIWGRNEAKLATAAEQLSHYGTRVSTAAVDVSELGEVEDAMRALVSELGRIDSAFANAGMGRGGPFLSSSVENYRAVLATNLDGVVWTLREAARHMVDRADAGDPGGSLVAVSSLAAIEGAARNQSYAASKGAVISVVNAIAVEFARYGVRANSILPGWTLTEMSGAAADNPKFTERVIGRVPSRRWGTPADFGGIAVYLASDASSYHSGDSLIIDGGYTIY
jgi:NAD(P)-dependent dehydrogenase (short-subunit alcohol dehydrogenase family)